MNHKLKISGSYGNSRNVQYLQENILESAYSVCFALSQVKLHNKQKLVDSYKNRPW